MSFITPASYIPSVIWREKAHFLFSIKCAFFLHIYILCSYNKQRIWHFCGPFNDCDYADEYNLLMLIWASSSTWSLLDCWHNWKNNDIWDPLSTGWAAAGGLGSRTEAAAACLNSAGASSLHFLHFSPMWLSLHVSSRHFDQCMPCIVTLVVFDSFFSKKIGQCACLPLWPVGGSPTPLPLKDRLNKQARNFIHISEQRKLLPELPFFSISTDHHGPS